MASQASVAVATAKTGVAGQSIVAARPGLQKRVLYYPEHLSSAEALDELPHASVAVHVLVTLYDPAHSPDVVTSAEVSVNELPQASVAVATAKTGAAGQSIVDGDGNAAITGAVISCTLMVCEALDELPQSSVAVQVLVTLYDPAQAPVVVTSEEVSVKSLPQASVAVATAKTGELVQSMVVVAGSA
ncbi:MAG: hypothetical protein IPP15_22530 [Saprospiraceae bacterium]|uniref:Uncharacterized protein n=1 Tax=Candidatus Opimibacter skivensis TaxID=2982028 RepID=A0A9D7SXU6_9BACT|nr:hypothetical protein [Candidatus Opimibacter skivensis]